MSVFRAIYHCRRPRAGIIKLLRTMGKGKRLNETKRNALFALQPKKRLRGDNVIYKQIAIMLRDAFMSWLTEAFVFVNSSVAVRPYQLMCTSWRFCQPRRTPRRMHLANCTYENFLMYPFSHFIFDSLTSLLKLCCLLTYCHRE